MKSSLPIVYHPSLLKCLREKHDYVGVNNKETKFKRHDYTQNWLQQAYK